VEAKVRNAISVEIKVAIAAQSIDGNPQEKLTAKDAGEIFKE